MPTYTYRREDGTTFEIRQKFSDDPLDIDPKTGQKVERIISNPTGIIFKGSGFYVTDNRGARKTTSTGADSNDNGTKADTTGSTKSDAGDKSTPKADSGKSSKEKKVS
jgi:putative FmdB family regulatory protein